MKHIIYTSENDPWISYLRASSVVHAGLSRTEDVSWRLTFPMLFSILMSYKTKIEREMVDSRME